MKPRVDIKLGLLQKRKKINKNQEKKKRKQDVYGSKPNLSSGR